MKDKKIEYCCEIKKDYDDEGITKIINKSIFELCEISANEIVMMANEIKDKNIDAIIHNAKSIEEYLKILQNRYNIEG